MQFDSWVDSKIHLIDAERYVHMHWSLIREDIIIRREMAEREGALLVTRYDSKHQNVPYSMAILQFSDAVVFYIEEDSHWFIAKNRFNNPNQWKGSDRDLAMKLNNHMMEMIDC